MFALYRQSNPSEIILGWYTTGDSINEGSILIHDFYGREIQRPPVHVCVGCDLSQGQGVTLSAYMSSSVALKDRLYGSHFVKIPLSIAPEGSDTAVLEAARQQQVGGSLTQVILLLFFNSFFF
jgi:translation initiation factor 3 subunit F